MEVTEIVFRDLISERHLNRKVSTEMKESIKEDLSWPAEFFSLILEKTLRSKQSFFTTWRRANKLNKPQF